MCMLSWDFLGGQSFHVQTGTVSYLHFQPRWFFVIFFLVWLHWLGVLVTFASLWPKYLTETSLRRKCLFLLLVSWLSIHYGGEGWQSKVVHTMVLRKQRATTGKDQGKPQPLRTQPQWTTFSARQELLPPPKNLCKFWMQHWIKPFIRSEPSWARKTSQTHPDTDLLIS
jgi:hypothetical protein